MAFLGRKTFEYRTKKMRQMMAANGVDSLADPLGRVPALVPEIRLVPCLPEMRALRFVKCAEELSAHRDAGALSDWGQARYRENIRPGRRLQELDFTLAAMISEEAATRFPGEAVARRRGVFRRARNLRLWSRRLPPRRFGRDRQKPETLTNAPRDIKSNTIL